MSTRVHTSILKIGIAQWLEGLLPPPEGGPPPAVTAARTRFSALIQGAIGLTVGCVTGFLLVLLLWGIPEIPSLVAGLALGTFLGSAIALALATRSKFVRRGGILIVLAAPLLVLLAPFLLLAGGVTLLRKWPKQRKRRR